MAYLHDWLPEYSIDVAVGAPQADIKAAYIKTLREDAASKAADHRYSRELKTASRAGMLLSATRRDDLYAYYLDNPPPHSRMRYHSFVRYFAMLRALGWVEITPGESTYSMTEVSEIQEIYAKSHPAIEAENAPVPERLYYRLTALGKRTTRDDHLHPKALLYAGKHYEPRKRASAGRPGHIAPPLPLEGQLVTSSPLADVKPKRVPKVPGEPNKKPGPKPKPKVVLTQPAPPKKPVAYTTRLGPVGRRIDWNSTVDQIAKHPYNERYLNSAFKKWIDAYIKDGWHAAEIGEAFTSVSAALDVGIVPFKKEYDPDGTAWAGFIRLLQSVDWSKLTHDFPVQGE
jgi:cell division septation protein DedD